MITFYYFLLQVFAPNSVYIRQKLNKLVRRKIIATISRTIPKVPVSILVKKRITIKRATKVLKIRSAVPMFFFISFLSLSNFLFMNYKSSSAKYKQNYERVFCSASLEIIMIDMEMQK